MEIEGDRLNHSTKTNNMVQPILQEMSLKEAHESFSSDSRGPIHEDRKLQIKELDEWQTHKPRTPDKQNLRQNKLNPFPNQLKVRDRVLLDATNPHIVATTSNEEIPLTVLTIFPFGTVEVSHPKFDTFKVPCHHHEERKPPYLLRKRGRESHLLRGGERALASSTLTMPTSYSVCRTGTSLALPISSPSVFSTRQSGIGRGSSPLAPMLLGWLDTSGSSAPWPKNHPVPSSAKCLQKVSQACLA
ncbi:hypothetical protein GOBAR_AA12649 [Gossypium barbadense]|uniref:Uncharacterized protein n=1 Tax=Gossypium barbadense TaxID=3634 RepID=A0A2P5XXB5_GOSBA|nr:hypothetical protein GOBAR_AA12649 [Gossypium barbadense]